MGQDKDGWRADDGVSVGRTRETRTRGKDKTCWAKGAGCAEGRPQYGIWKVSFDPRPRFDHTSISPPSSAHRRSIPAMP